MSKTNQKDQEYMKPPEKPAGMTDLDYLTVTRQAITELLMIDAKYMQLHLEQKEYSLAAETATAKIALGGRALAMVNRKVEAELDRLYQEGKEEYLEQELRSGEVRG